MPSQIDFVQYVLPRRDVVSSRVRATRAPHCPPRTGRDCSAHFREGSGQISVVLTALWERAMFYAECFRFCSTALSRPND